MTMNGPVAAVRCEGGGECLGYGLRRKRQVVERKEARLVVSSSR